LKIIKTIFLVFAAGSLTFFSSRAQTNINRADTIHVQSHLFFLSYHKNKLNIKKRDAFTLMQQNPKAKIELSGIRPLNFFAGAFVIAGAVITGTALRAGARDGKLNAPVLGLGTFCIIVSFGFKGVYNKSVIKASRVYNEGLMGS